jgi:hypothetical protein
MREGKSAGTIEEEEKGKRGEKTGREKKETRLEAPASS